MVSTVIVTRRHLETALCSDQELTEVITNKNNVYSPQPARAAHCLVKLCPPIGPQRRAHYGLHSDWWRESSE